MRNLLLSSLIATTIGCAGETPPRNEPGGTEPDAATGAQTDAPAPDAPKIQFSFFVTSVGLPNGGDLRATPADTDGLAGADAHCRALAIASVPGAETRTWRAYLSTAAINAKDRIGAGPWFNVAGTMVAANLADLHNPAVTLLGAANSLDEKGQPLANGVHDVLTGSNADGTTAVDLHCTNWTASTGSDSQLGHSDVTAQWNVAHVSAGCTTVQLTDGGGRGSYYCFAAD